MSHQLNKGRITFDISRPIAEKAGVNVWFFPSGLCRIVLTTGVLIRYLTKYRREKG